MDGEPPPGDEQRVRTAAPASAAPPVNRSRRFMLHLGYQLVDIHEIVWQVRRTHESRTNALGPLHRGAGSDRDPGFVAILRSRFAPSTSDGHRGGGLDREAFSRQRPSR